MVDFSNFQRIFLVKNCECFPFPRDVFVKKNDGFFPFPMVILDNAYFNGNVPQKGDFSHFQWQLLISKLFNKVRISFYLQKYLVLTTLDLLKVLGKSKKKSPKWVV